MSASEQLVGTPDRETAHQAVADVYFPHELAALDGRDDVDLPLRTVELGGATIGRHTWGTAVSIACHYPGAYEVNIPLSGRLHSRSGHGELVSTGAPSPSPTPRPGGDSAVRAGSPRPTAVDTG